MAQLTDDALLLRRIPFSESSLICHFLTKEHGRISLMVRGARKAKSPFRAALAPLYEVQIDWQTGRTGMGQLRAIQRRKACLDEKDTLQGLELLSMAAHLFQDGDEYAYQIVRDALRIFYQRGGEQGLCVSVWFCLQQAGWLGNLSHCWHCGREVEGSMLWHADQLGCLDCLNAGLPVSVGLRKGVEAAVKYEHIHLSQSDLKTWQRMIALLFGEHHIKVSESFL